MILEWVEGLFLFIFSDDEKYIISLVDDGQLGQIIILDFDVGGNPQVGAASLVQTITQDVNLVNLNTYFSSTKYSEIN